MQVVYSEDELLHNPAMELTNGEWKPYVESPKRLIAIKEWIDKHSEFEVIEARDYSLEPILNVHKEDYINFLKCIYQEWVDEGRPANACLADTFVSINKMIDQEMIKKAANKTSRGKLGYYTADLSVTFMKDTWQAIYASAQVGLTAAHQLMKTSAPAIYALCRPPGHHASHSLAAGYCYVNNVAVITRFLQDYALEDMKDTRLIRQDGRKRVLIVDVDYHHGNGTQEIFYEDPSVFYLSLHAYPDYPYFTGSDEERGTGLGTGYNLNVPLSPNTTTDSIYLDTLKAALSNPNLVKFDAEAVVVSLGLDTWHEDPIAGMKGLKDPETYKTMGALIKLAAQGRPVLFVQEGGYTIEKLGELAVNVLKGYME